MVRGPDRPISFEKARRLLWERLAANAGIDLDRQLERAEEQPKSDAAKVLDEQVEALWTDADISLQGWLIIEELHYWTEEGGVWTSGARETLKGRLLRPRDEPWELYVDRDELAALMPTCGPGMFQSSETTQVPARPNDRTPNRRGRPPGSGAYDDILLLKDMAKLLQADPSLSLPGAALMVVDRAKGTRDTANRAKRLCRKFKGMPGEGA
jgi:hypothetical protein